ncbi:MAG: PEP-CTERM sorting domain-containing protein [Sulfuritalea sp.]|nr:PEP-CTERM sorting domain-containing protein [Sulfuritalea sp.]
MKKMLLISSALAMIGVAPVAQAATSSYNITTTWYEPDTQPRDSIFIGSFTFDDVSHTVSGLHGILSESMSGDPIAYPNDNMAWLTLNNQLVSWHDNTLGGTFAAAFRNTNTNTFTTMLGGDGWSPQAGVDVGGVYYGFPNAANNPENAYALIFVPDNPLAALTQAQLDKVAYADCVKLSGSGGINGGGMMGAVCMTGTSVAGYGAIGTMSGYPVSQAITLAAPVPEPESYAMLLAGLGLLGFIARRRRLALK